MTLRRCDSLPTRLREAPVPNPGELDENQTDKRIPDSNTITNLTEQPDREQVIAAWQSLQTDVKKIKNGFPLKNGPTPTPSHHKKEPITQNPYPSYAYRNSIRKKHIYANKKVGINGQDVDRCSSYPLATSKLQSTVETANFVRRRTLLDRLLPWRSRDCDCQERYRTKFRTPPTLPAEDLLCTCGVNGNRINLPDMCKTNSERGRSKSVGYEAAREVTQFRRLVQCLTYKTGS